MGRRGRAVQVAGILSPWSSTSTYLLYRRLTNSIQLVRKTNSWGGLSPWFSTFHMDGIPWRNTPGYLLPLPSLPRKKRFVTFEFMGGPLSSSPHAPLEYICLQRKHNLCCQPCGKISGADPAPTREPNV